MSDFNDTVINEFRSNNGTVTTAGFGDNLVLLHSIGAKSGETRINPVLGIPDSGGWLVIGSAAGSPRNPAWVHNLRANPRIDVEVPGADEVRTVSMEVSEIPDEEWDGNWKKFTDKSQGFVEYTKSAQGRRFPIFRLTPA
ncbi:nitroreductase/quinone reductase family protein [Williamsia sterculiae]|uniref:Deazaflavin-dependent oxidoreductase, nitroreductase family n=1 Tax=Williamsia sterculiae TaxID=1344003 RepID=A0A1N7FKI3_9NOCA|nr:nitroreductase/quinone reductase family protein [Williamsia sterculiae]SIS00800.1 deazaflavin-dependent oxidoreductase, nitroreductase family [Williamsia sterculiae]